MARKRHSDEDILKLLREIELKLASGDDVASACRSVGISDATYYNWRKRFGGMGRAHATSSPEASFSSISRSSFKMSSS
ncbi:MAG: transposase, partial [Pseudomonadota bacterium]